MADSQKKLIILPDNPLCGIKTNKDTLNLATGACTRQIKSKVIPPDYSTITATAITNGTRFEISFILGTNALPNQGICTHAVYSTGWNTFNAFSISRTNGHIYMARTDISTVEEFRAWLADQSVNGTPVTVWYALATPEETTITVPIGLSGTEEGYLIQDGTPTPTNPIYPTANIVEIWHHSLRKLTTATEAVENPLYTDGTAITAYTIKGNTVQSGTPTPSNPVSVNGVGERTANLFDKNSMVVGYYLAKATGVYTATTGESRSVLVKVEPSTTYTITGTSWTKRIALFDNMPQNGDTPNYYSDNDTTAYEETSFTFTTLPTTQYLVFFNYSGSTEYPYNKTLNEVMGSVMLNTGSTAKPYEPYGIKIPISSAGQTIDIYIGDLPLLKSLDGTAVDEISNGILTRRVDSDGSVLPTPTTTQITMPSIPTTEGANSITVDTTVQPSEFTATWTGWHDATVKEKSENLWGATTETNKYIDRQGNIGTASNGDIFDQKGITVVSSTNYTFSWSDAVLDSEDNTPYIRICFYTSNGGTFISRTLVTPSSYPNKYVTFAIPNNCTYVDIRVDSETSTRGQHFENIMLNTGSTALPYEPYWK